jgi:hypothetical protein
MRILIGLALGLAIGLSALVQLMGWFQWCPESAFTIVHAPAMLLTDLLVHGEQAGWSAMPFTIIAQWLLVGAAFGLALHFRYALRQKVQPGASPNGGPPESSGNQGGVGGPPSVS